MQRLKKKKIYWGKWSAFKEWK